MTSLVGTTARVISVAGLVLAPAAPAAAQNEAAPRAFCEGK
jgi:hypothetical protein